MNQWASGLFIILFMITGCGNKGASVGSTAEVNAAPTGTYSSLRPTIYYLPSVDADSESCSSNELHDVKGTRDQNLITLCEKTYKNCLMQGTCLIKKSGSTLLLNYSGSINGSPTFTFSDRSICPYGYGVSKICLDPYFSAAADLNYYKAGDVIFVTKLRGLSLPDGRIHDGYVVIRDRGGNITGPDRFDFFTGDMAYKDPRNTMTKLGLADKKNHFEFMKVDEVLAEKIRQDRLFPRIRK